jgi:protein-arginine kinase activator protein McsA
VAKFTQRQLAAAQDLVNRKVEEVKTQRKRNLFYLNCAACLHQIDLADFVETGLARCPECNQLNKADVNSIQMRVENLI